MGPIFVVFGTPSCLGSPIFSTLCSCTLIMHISGHNILLLHLLLGWLSPLARLLIFLLSQRIPSAGQSLECPIYLVPAVGFFVVFMVSPLQVLVNWTWCPSLPHSWSRFAFPSWLLSHGHSTKFTFLGTHSVLLFSRGVPFECTDGGCLVCP